MTSALENLKNATAEALIAAIESKNIAYTKQLFTIYYEVQQMDVPKSTSTFEFNYSYQDEDILKL